MKVEIKDNSIIAGTYRVDEKGNIEGLDRFAKRLAMVIIIDEASVPGPPVEND